MPQKKKKIFPKAKKKFQNFLTDESGQITKQGALGLSAGAALLATFDSVDAAVYHHNTSADTSHTNHSNHANHSSSNRSGPTHGNTTPHSNVTYGHFYNIGIDYTPGVGCNSNHLSGMVNGHANEAIDNGGTLTPTAINSITGHANHVSHGNHGSGGWC